jgi:hypothetical protein
MTIIRKTWIWSRTDYSTTIHLSAFAIWQHSRTLSSPSRGTNKFLHRSMWSYRLILWMVIQVHKVLHTLIVLPVTFVLQNINNWNCFTDAVHLQIRIVLILFTLVLFHMKLSNPFKLKSRYSPLYWKKWWLIMLTTSSTRDVLDFHKTNNSPKSSGSSNI